MDPSTSNSELERLLARATADVAARPAFYRAFLDSPLLVLCNAPDAQVDSSGRGVVRLEDVGAVVQMQDADGNYLIPVFSSFARLEETGAGRVTCIKLTGREVLELLGTEKPIVLNPMSDYGKEFDPRELAALRDGSIFAAEPEHRTYPPGAKALPGLPEGYPAALLDALRSVFARYPGLTRAYVASLDSPDPLESLHPVVAIDLSDNWFDIVRDAGTAAGGLLADDQFLDFLPLREGDELSDQILRGMEPFYTSG